MLLNRVNSIIVVFFAVIFFLSIGIWEFLQSDFMGSYLNERVNKVLPKEVKEKLVFEKVSIRFFPPGISLERIKAKAIEIPDTEMEVTAFLDELRFNFNIFNAIQNRITLKDLILSGGDVVVKGQLLEGSSSKEAADNSEVIKSIVQEVIPKYLKNLILDDVDLKSPWLNGIVKRSEMNFYNKITFMDFTGNSVNCLFEFCKKNLPESGYLDSIKLVTEILEDEVKIRQFELSYIISQLWGRGNLVGDIFKGEGLKFQGELNASVFLENFHDFNKEIKEYFGHFVTRSEFTIRDGELISRTEGDVYSMQTPYANVSNGSFKVRNEKDVLIVEKAVINDPDGYLETLNEFKLLNVKELKLLEPKFSVEFKKAHSNKVLYFLRRSLEPLKTSLTGIVDLDININRVKIKSQKINTNYLKLVDKSDPIFDFQSPEFSNLDINVDVNTEFVDIKTDMTLGGNSGSIEGQIRGKDLDAKINLAELNLEDLGEVAGLNFKGKGRGLLGISGPYDDVKFKFDVNARDAEFIELKLGEIRGELNLFLGRKYVEFTSLQSKVGPSVFNMAGKVDYVKKTMLDLDITSDNFVYDDLIKLLTPITKDIKYLPRGVVGRFSSKTKVQGPVENLAFSAKTTILGKDLFYKTESISRCSMEVTFIDRVLEFKNVNLYKDRGVIKPGLRYSLNKELLDYFVNFKNIPLTEFQILNTGNLGINGLLSLSLKGKSSKLENELDVQSNLLNSTVAGEEVPNSNLDLKLSKNKLKSSFRFMGNDISGELDFDLSGENKKTSRASIFVNSNNLKELISIFRPHNIRREDLFGRLTGRVEFSGPLSNLAESSLSLSLQDFSFISKDFNLKLDQDYSEFKINKGVVGVNEIKIIDGVNKIVLGGNGNLGKRFQVGANLSLKGEAFEFLSDRIIKSSGQFNFLFNFISNDGIDNVDSTINLQGRKFAITVQDVPASFSEVDFDATLENQFLNVQKITGLFGGGEFQSRGYIKFKFPFPEMDFKIKSDNSRLSLFKSTNFWISTNATLKGEEPPYLLSGDISVVNASVNDEIEDFKTSGRSEFSNPYLPQVKDGSGLNIIDLDLNVKSLRPIKIKNSLAAINFHTFLRLSDSLFSPRIRGDFRLVPGTGRFFFKNNDFILTRARVSLDGLSTLEPNFDFEGVTTINDYQIFLTVNGNPSNFEMNLSSNPSLSEDDIVGLLATGLTSDKTARLSEGEKESLTSLGIGAIIFDKFKINQELQSALGINLSIAPDIDEDNTNDVNEINRGRSRGQSRSTTKVQVRKKFTNKAYLSISSTVGGETGDRQKLNVNYDVSENLSVEGVYEVRSREEVDTNQENDSVGMDFKWRLEF